MANLVSQIPNSSGGGSDKLFELSHRDMKVILLLLEGMSIKQVAEVFEVGVYRISKVKAGILNKLRHNIGVLNERDALPWSERKALEVIEEEEGDPHA